MDGLSRAAYFRDAGGGEALRYSLDPNYRPKPILRVSEQQQGRRRGIVGLDPDQVDVYEHW
jgi:hypothetical protein